MVPVIVVVLVVVAWLGLGELVLDKSGSPS